MNEGYIFCLVGPSGAGKTSVLYELVERMHLSPVDSYTDRPKRTPDEKGHIFVTPQEYDKITDIVAETVFADHRYCATADLIDNNDLYVVDIGGLNSMKTLYKGKKKAVVFYLSVSPEVCAHRMRQDGRSPEIIEQRIRHDKEAFANVEEFATHVIDASRPLHQVADDIAYFIYLYLNT